MRSQGGSPAWSGITKALVALIVVGILGLLMIRFSTIIPILIAAWIVSYVLLPAVRFVHHRLHLPWALATNFCFILLILIILGASTATGLVVVQQLQALFLTLQGFLVSLPQQLEALSQHGLVVGRWAFDLSRFDLGLAAEQTLSTIQPVLGRASALITSLASLAIGSIGALIIVIAVAYFLTLDQARIHAGWSSIAIPGYEEDFRRLQLALGNIWNSFLRGQLIIVAVAGLSTWWLMSLLGVRFSAGLGVLGGLSKFVPILGPYVAGAIAAVVALFQPTNWLGLSPWMHAVAVVATLFITHQLVDYLLLPRIMGRSLNLQPATILIAAILGASLAGVIGLLLSAPAVASILLLGRYAYRKMIDRSPWDPPIDALSEQAPPRKRELGLPLLSRERQKEAILKDEAQRD